MLADSPRSRSIGLHIGSTSVFISFKIIGIAPLLRQIFIMGSYGHHVTGWGRIIAITSCSLGFLRFGFSPFLIRLGFLEIFGFGDGRFKVRISVLIGQLLRLPFRLIYIRSSTEDTVLVIIIDFLLFFFMFFVLALCSSNFPCVCSPGHIGLIQLGFELEMATLLCNTCSRIFWVSWAWRIVCRHPWGEYFWQAVCTRIVEESTMDPKSAERGTRNHAHSSGVTALWSMSLGWLRWSVVFTCLVWVWSTRR